MHNMDANINKHSIYIAYIRPHFEYECQVWDPHLIKEIHALESVKFALRACFKQWAAPYQAFFQNLLQEDVK